MRKIDNATRAKYLEQGLSIYGSLKKRDRDVVKHTERLATKFELTVVFPDRLFSNLSARCKKRVRTKFIDEVRLAMDGGKSYTEAVEMVSKRLEAIRR